MKRLYPVILADFPDMVITSSILFNRFNNANFGSRIKFERGLNYVQPFSSLTIKFNEFFLIEMRGRFFVYRVHAIFKRITSKPNSEECVCGTIIGFWLLDQ